MLLIGNEAAGQWTQTSALDNPAYTAKMIGTWMNSFRTAVGNSTTEARPIVNRDNGKYLFGSLCANCHTIGRGEKIGPDLSVALDTRERDWVARYTFQPDVMRLKNDPIAMALMKKFGQVRMPNLGLEGHEVNAILRYIEAEKSTAVAAGDAPAVAVARSAAKTTPSGLIEPTIAVQVALAHDTSDGVRMNAAAVRQAAETIGAPAAAIARAAADLETQTTIADVRRAFGVMSDALIAYLKTANAPLIAGARVAYCPMVRRSWLQMDGPLANPYYGSKMLGCGEFTTLTD
jgi:mono/diheme cytochrome c family protein